MATRCCSSPASSHAINAAIKAKLSYDPVKDFAPVSRVVPLPDLLLLNPSLPAHSVRELIALARKEPGKIAFGSAGSGSGTPMDAELFRSMAGIDLLHVPYKGGTPSVTALVAGQVQMMSSNRVGSLPDVPWVDEAGVPGYEAQTWYGLLAPKGTPPAIIDTLNRAVGKVLAMPDVCRQIEAAGGQAQASTPRASVILEHEGLVVIERNKGAHVRRFTTNEAIKIAEVRSALESLMIRYAAACRVREQLWRISGHETGRQIMLTLDSQLIRIGFHAIFQPGRPEQILADIERVVTAVAANRAPEAIEAIHDYHAHSMAALMQALDKASLPRPVAGLAD